MSLVHSGLTPSIPAAEDGHVAALPAPRLQMRWEKRAEPHHLDWNGERSWNCFYELVLPLREFDIRREVYENGEQVGEVEQLVVPMKGPTVRGSNGTTPCSGCEGALYYDTPIRDGAHAQWDSEVLGGLPIFVIAPDGSAIAKATPGAAPSTCGTEPTGEVNPIPPAPAQEGGE